MTAQLSNPNESSIDLITILNERLAGHESEVQPSQKSFLRNEYIYLSHPADDTVYVVKEGRVKIGISDNDEKEIIKRVVGKGEIFGAFSIIGKSNKHDYAVAMEETEVYILTNRELLALIPDQNDLSQFFMQLLGNRLINMEQRLESMVFKSSRSRVIDFLDRLVAKKGQRVGYEMMVRNFFTHQEIASLTATSRQTVTTVLNDLKNKNILIFNRRRLLIRDMGLLRAEMS